MKKYDLPPAPFDASVKDFDLRSVMPMADILPYIDAIALRKKADNERTEWVDTQNKVIKSAIKQLIWAKALSGSLPEIQNGEGHKIRFLSAWNKVSNRISGRDIGPEGSKEVYLDTVADGIVRGVSGILFPVARMGLDPNNNHTRESAYEEIIRILETGAFESEGYKCHTDGEHYQFFSDAWNPVGKCRQITGPGLASTLTDMKPMGLNNTQTVEHIEIEFETGELLVADLIRIDEFDKLWRELPYVSISSDAGRIQFIKQIWDNLGYLDIWVGESMPHIIEQDGVLKFADVDKRLSYEDWQDRIEEWSKYHHVELGRKAVCIIDKQRLLEHLISETGDLSRAQEKLDSYIHSGDAHSLQVKPGKYHLYLGFSEEHGLSNHEFEGLDTKDMHTFFIISPDELSHSMKNDIISEDNATTGPRL